MSSKDHTTSIKLGPELRIKLKMLAGQRRCSAHSIMKEAIAAYLLRAEVALWEEYLNKNPTIATEPELVRRAHQTLPAVPKGLPPHVLEQIAAGNHRLRVLRGWRGMSHGRLIAAIEDLGGGVSETVLAAIEDGTLRPDAGLSVMLARALNVTVDELMG